MKLAASEECGRICHGFVTRNWWTPNLTNPKIRYAFVTEYGLTLCEPNFMTTTARMAAHRKLD
jgi:hypothetical protein